MQVRAITKLLQLNDTKLYKQISIGLRLIHENVNELLSSALLLSRNKKGRGCKILYNIANEESAKFIILIDSLRCPRRTSDENNIFTRQLKRFQDHLSKGIYCKYYNWKPSDFKEVRKLIEIQRKKYYLDGPFDYEWIFYNQILFNRENTMYVDYISTDESDRWIAPNKDNDNPYSEIELSSPIIKIVQIMYNLGLTDIKALTLISEHWRKIKIHDNFTWRELREINFETLKLLEKNKILQEGSDEDISFFVNCFLFPLYSIKIDLINNKKNKL